MTSAVNKAVMYVMGGWVLFAICLQTWGVFSRNVLSRSTAWLDDLQRLNFIWLIWIGAALAYQGRGLISLDLVQSKLVGKVRAYHAMTLGKTVFELAFAGIFTYLSFQIIAKQAATQEVTTVLHLPLAVVNLGFCIGSALLFIFAVRKLIQSIHDIKVSTPVDVEETKPREA